MSIDTKTVSLLQTSFSVGSNAGYDLLPACSVMYMHAHSTTTRGIGSALLYTYTINSTPSCIHKKFTERPLRSVHIPSYRILYRAPYSLALVCAFLRMGSSLVAFMTLPLILSLPDMNSLWALPFPVTRLSKSVSDRVRVTVLLCQRAYAGLVSVWLRRRTIRLATSALADFALVLEVDVPAIGLTGGVLQGEGVDALAHIDGFLLVGLAGLERAVHGIEEGRGRELIWQEINVRLRNAPACVRACVRACLPFFSDIFDIGGW